MYELIDSHAHLESFKNLKEVVRRAERIGVKAIVGVGSDYNSSKYVLKISEEEYVSKIYPAIGVHPWSLHSSNLDLNLTFKFIESNVDRAVALGEVGLDYWLKNVRKNPVEKEFQRNVFRKILDIAKDNDKPVIIHSRGAWSDCLTMVLEAGVKKAVFHWFSGPSDVLKKLLNHGYFISATPAAEYSKYHQEAILNTPLERILLETDSPVSYLGKTAEPADVVRTLKAVSKLKEVEEGEVAAKTTENALKVFDINL